MGRVSLILPAGYLESRSRVVERLGHLVGGDLDPVLNGAPRDLAVGADGPATKRHRGSFAARGTRNYRLYFSGQIVSVSGTWFQRAALAWTVLKISGDATDVAVAVALGAVAAVRGRVMAWWALAFAGTTPIGAPAIGAVAQHRTKSRPDGRSDATITTVAGSRGQLADLEEVAVGVTEEGPDLPAPVDGVGDEGGTPRPEQLVGSPAVVDPEDDLRTDAVRIGRRRERHGRLVGRGFSAGHEQDPVPEELEHHRGSPVLPVDGGVEDPRVPVPARSGVRHDQEVGERRGLELVHDATR